MTGTLIFGLDLRASALVILFFSLLGAVPVGYLATIGPKTGMRQMIQARYSFGYFPVCIPVILNMATLTGFCILDSVLGGQTLSAVGGGSLSPTVGIVIVALVSMIVCFCGFRILHLYERYAWIPALIAIIVATGVGGHQLHRQAKVESIPASAVLSFAGLIAGYVVPWAALASDFATYMQPQTSSWKVFSYTFFGINIPTIPLMVLGAAIGGAMPNVPAWSDANKKDSGGGVLAAMLDPVGGFGKFLVVLIAFSIVGNIAATMYSITLNFQLLIPWLVKVPRAVFAVVITAIVIPISIKASGTFYENLENFIGIIGYWASAFVAIVIMEHLLFRRKGNPGYDHETWNDARRLPTGLAALAAMAVPFGLIVPCMGQVLYTGPIAKHTGDVGFEVAFVLAAMLYPPIRFFEVKLRGRR
ncbi:cytosine-purine permease [Piedraia hortae CBS 480.64]|uniref:Cytosine-purine permease n=1 Tax=Piedraia hortae CBS 480.64 TaxID=1314780 RepID=A0A6A7C4C2_9PEZI|nr:cytosine-purine permease [Piedraia hortae CBS 480.64]